MLEFCSNLNWNTITAVSSMGLLFVTAWAAYSVHRFTRYGFKEKAILDIMALYEKAYSIFLDRPFCSPDFELLMDQARAKSMIHDFCDIAKHIEDIMELHANGFRLNEKFNNSLEQTGGYNLSKEKMDIDNLFRDYTSFKKLLKAL